MRGNAQRGDVALPLGKVMGLIKNDLDVFKKHRVDRNQSSS